MATSISTGFSNNADSYKAGFEAAKSAANNFDYMISVVITFCNGKHNPNEFLEGVRSITGDVPLIGGAAMGVFNNTNLCYEEYEGMVTLISSDTIQFKLFAQDDLDKDESIAGAELARQINKKSGDKDRGLIILYDTVKTRNPMRFNFATPLFKAIEEIINPDICCVGCGLVGDLQLIHSFQFFNDQVLEQHVMALLISGDCKMDNIIMHGCKPASSYKTITRAEGPVIFEIDNRPALDVIDELVSAGNRKIPWDEYPLFVTLGLNKGDPFGEFNEQDYANRLCLAVDKENKALIMFEPDLGNGDQIQLMQRSIDLDYVENRVNALRSETDKTKPLLFFYINCVGRAKPFSGSKLEDVEEVQKIIGSEIPFMGFYSGVEVAKVRNRIQALDWTGVLCLLSE